MKRTCVILFIFFMLISLTSCSGMKLKNTVESNTSDLECCDSILYPVYLNGMFTYVDYNGNVKTDCKYKAARFISDGLYAVCIGDKWGFIDSLGNVVIPCQYASVGDFSDGLASIKINKKYGFINKQGVTVINNEFDDVTKFSEGYAYVVRESPYGEYIDKAGNTVFCTELLYGSEFSEGIAVLSSYLSQSSYHQYIDVNGNLLLENDINNTRCGLYKNGLAFIPVLEDENIKYIYIDKFGKNYFNDYFDFTDSFNENLAVIEKNGHRGVIDNKGKLIYSNDTVYGQYSEGYITYYKEIDGLKKYGFLDEKGNVSIDAQYDSILKNFTDGLALVKLNEMLLYIDHNGEIIYEFEEPEYKFWVY